MINFKERPGSVVETPARHSFELDCLQSLDTWRLYDLLNICFEVEKVAQLTWLTHTFCDLGLRSYFKPFVVVIANAFVD